MNSIAFLKFCGISALIALPFLNNKPNSKALPVSKHQNQREVHSTQTHSKKVNTAQLTSDSIPPDQTGMRNIPASALAKEMVQGWNLGNALDAVGGETAWGNPKSTKRLIDSVKAAGFNAVRIPVAWSRFTDTTDYSIDTAWMQRVQQVADYVLKDGMYAIINIHWDGGWMQPTYAQQRYVNRRLWFMWRQIATAFRDYGDHLLFAGTNEVMVTNQYGTPSVENYTVQNSFNQEFVLAVRSTGGRNAYRNLIIQGYNTNIDYTVAFLKIPRDYIANKLIVEVHFYDPFTFTIQQNSKITQWGKDATDPSKVEAWGNEDHVDGQFKKMENTFVDKGIPVIVGEYAASARLHLGSADANSSHARFRNYYDHYVTQSAIAHNLVPFYWDSGNTGDSGSALFNRKTGAKAYPELVKSITGK
jgi:endoglucanase